VLPDFARFDEGRIFVGPIVLVPHFPSGSDALAEAVERGLVEPTRPSLVLMQNHGALSVGQSVDEALLRLEVAEHLAATLIAAGRVPD
jgi:L-fuculose-phosphate aldolase